MLPSRVYLSGGGICAMAHVGALIEMNNHVPLKAIKEWMGVSAGSFVAMCFCIGFTLEEMEEFSMRFDFTNIKEMDSVPGWILHFGMDTGERLQRLIEACLHIKGLPSTFTFLECFKQFGKSLRIVATDMNEAAAKIFSYEETPTYPVAFAVRASMTVPYYFQPFICPETGHSLVDGSVVSNYPLFVLPQEEHAKTMSIIIRTCIEKKEDLNELQIDELILRPINITIIERTTIESRFYGDNYIQIQLGEMNILDFGLNDAMKEIIINKGKKATIEYFSKYASKIRRRNSF
jgi:NTE family protein